MIQTDEGIISIDSEGHILWNPKNGKVQVLTENDSLCGIGLLATGVDDPFRNCCAWHDRAYEMRSFFEERGWDRKKIDDYFRSLMYKRAGSNKELFYRANIYYKIVRMLGWIFYYRHEASNSSFKAVSNKDNDECKNMLDRIVKEIDNGSM